MTHDFSPIWAMEVPTMVIKVKYQETHRRFNVRVTDDEIDLNMDRLREKLLTLFNLTPNTELMLSYIDEDGDEVALVDDDDLCDVRKQALDPLRITIKLNSEKNGIRHCPSGNSTPLKSQSVQQPLQNCRKILKPVPEPLYETVVKLSSDLASKASSSASGVTDLVEYFSKVGLSYLAHHSDSQHAARTMTQSDVTESSAAATTTKNLEPSKVDGATLKVPSNGGSDKRSLRHNESLENQKEQWFHLLNDEKLGIASGVIMKATSLTVPGFNEVALESQNISVGQPVIAESKVVPDRVDKKETAMKERIEKIGEFHAKDKPFVTTSHLPPVLNTDWFIGKIGSGCNFPTEKATNIRGPSLQPYPFNSSASNPIKVDHVGGRTKSLFLGSFGNSTSSIWAPYRGILNSPDLCSSPSPTDDCPISRIPVENAKAFQSHPASRLVTSSGCGSQIVDTFHVFHCGIFCDGCGVHPITGPRFKSKVKENYDLCMICFAEMGNASDYIRIDRPVVYPHHVLYDSHAKDRDPVSSQDCRGFKVKSCLSKMDSCFITDVNIPDNTVMAPLTPFTKVWRLKNNGIIVWPKKTIIFWMGGDKLSNELSVELKIPATGLAINQELDVAVDCIAPELPGKYESCWGLASPSGQRFGQLIWIRIKVVTSVAAKPLENIRSFNLNLPPLSSCLNDPETINVVPESIVENCQIDPENNYNSFVPSYTAPVSHPIFDLSNMAAAFPSIRSDVLHPFLPLPDINLPASEDEGMSFKSVNLNNDVSTMSEDDLDLDDVSEISEWDSILDELLDMGFYDIETNKKLLEKNNGSIKHVVMELIAAESK
ncbi:protein JOKA2-like isoform X1 [Primulina tabacum]|uniref:protein JOKA2-like isoform X1 n=2 Tax=Primulina tabacum TaxID=48773 RepID=UPI003F599148